MVYSLVMLKMISKLDKTVHDLQRADPLGILSTVKQNIMKTIWTFIITNIH
jgi:hypothetical protein